MFGKIRELFSVGVLLVSWYLLKDLFSEPGVSLAIFPFLPALGGLAAGAAGVGGAAAGIGSSILSGAGQAGLGVLGNTAFNFQGDGFNVGFGRTSQQRLIEDLFTNMNQKNPLVSTNPGVEDPFGFLGKLLSPRFSFGR